MIPELHKDQIVGTGLEFLKALSRAYGGEQALVMFEEMTKIVDPEIYSATFMAMLAGGNTGPTLRINSIPRQGLDKIEFIRAIRTWDIRKLNLNDARDILTTLENGGFVDLAVHHNNLGVLGHRLAALGCNVK